LSASHLHFVGAAYTLSAGRLQLSVSRRQLFWATYTCRRAADNFFEPPTVVGQPPTTFLSRRHLSLSRLQLSARRLHLSARAEKFVRSAGKVSLSAGRSVTTRENMSPDAGKPVGAPERCRRVPKSLWEPPEPVGEQIGEPGALSPEILPPSGSWNRLRFEITPWPAAPSPP
jgi:hypothetical protein